MPKAAATDPRLHIRLFDAEAPDCELSLDHLPIELNDVQLLWLDLCTDDRALIEDVCESVGWDARITAGLTRSGATPALEDLGQVFVVNTVAARHEGQLEFTGQVLNIAVGCNIVMTVHAEPVAFIDEIRARDSDRSELGALSAESFAASLLDWQLSTYFDAVSDFEIAVERLEVGILGGGAHKLDELQSLRRGASRLRRMLAPHRRLFAGLARPDFRPRQDGEVNAHFQSLDVRYERAMDMVENARDLVVGSFELFTSQTAWRTNRTMQALTFYTVILGTLAVVAGIFGMNFEAPFFRATHGFWWSLGSMAVFFGAGTLLARRRKWL